MSNTPQRIKAIVDTFIRSDYFASWSAENVESGGYARPSSDARDRYNRCHDAAENGADGSTHRERIEDMRSAFKDWLYYHKRTSYAGNYPYRLESAVMAHFDRLETWHEQNGSLDQEVG